jgi:hypothetical protein
MYTAAAAAYSYHHSYHTTSRLAVQLQERTTVARLLAPRIKYLIVQRRAIIHVDYIQVMHASLVGTPGSWIEHAAGILARANRYASASHRNAMSNTVCSAMFFMYVSWA